MPMDDILADLLKTSGRTEQKLDDLSQRVEGVLNSHEARITKMEQSYGRLAMWGTIISLPFTLAAKAIGMKR